MNELLSDPPWTAIVGLVGTICTAVGTAIAVIWRKYSGVVYDTCVEGVGLIRDARVSLKTIMESHQRAEQYWSHTLHRTDKGRTKMLLLIEDDEVDADIIKRHLSSLMDETFTKPMTCKTLKEAHEWWYAADAVLADAALPDAHWETTLSFLTSNGKHRKQVALYTGNVDPKVKAAADREGVPILDKGGDPSELVELVRGMLS